MVLQHRALVRGEQLAALGDLVGEARGEAIRALGPVLVDDVDDQAPVAVFGLRLVAERAEGALQLGQVFADLPLHARPGVVVVLERRTAPVRRGAPGSARGRSSRRCPCRAVRAAAARPTAGRWPRTAAAARRPRRARRCVARRRALAVAACSPRDRARLAGLAQTPRAPASARVSPASTRGAGIGQLPLQFLDLGADGFAQHLEPGARLLRPRCGPSRAVLRCCFRSSRASLSRARCRCRSGSARRSSCAACASRACAS